MKQHQDYLDIVFDSAHEAVTLCFASVRTEGLHNIFTFLHVFENNHMALTKVHTMLAVANLLSHVTIVSLTSR